MSSVDSYIDTLGISVEDYSALSSTEKQELIREKLHGLTNDELEAMKEDILEEVSDINEDLESLEHSLRAIIDSANVSPIDKKQAEEYLDKIEEISDDTSTYGFRSDLNNATQSTNASSGFTRDADGTLIVEEHDHFELNFERDLEDGTETRIRLNNPEKILDKGPGWVDSDGDGVDDFHADTDGDGIADGDSNGDGEINPDDLKDYHAQDINAQTFTIEAGDDATKTLSSPSYDPATQTLRFTLTDENGNEEVIIIEGVDWENSIPQIILEGDGIQIATDDLDSWPPEFTHMLFEGSDADHSVGEIHDGLPISYDMSSYSSGDGYDHQLSISVTSEDYANGQNYEIDGTSLTSEQLVIQDLSSSPEATITQEMNGDDLVITLTNDNGESITFTVKGFEFKGDTSSPDNEDTIKIKLSGQTYMIETPEKIASATETTDVDLSAFDSLLVNTDEENV
jgi:hypothetical protein